MVYMDVGHLLVLLLLLQLWSSELQTEGKHNSEEFVRLQGGRCTGTLQLKHHEEWRPVNDLDSVWTLRTAAVACRELDCGSAVSVEQRKDFSYRSVWDIRSYCVESGSALSECATSSFSYHLLDLTCSDSVRLVNGTSLCSGRLEVKNNQSPQRWSLVCEADFDWQDAKVVCRELGCGNPSVIEGALYGEVEAPMRTKEFQCGGNEAALLDCGSLGLDGNVTCSPGKAVGLTCSEPIRLRGVSRCAGTLTVKHQGEWRPVSDFNSVWTPKTAAVACRELDCGSAVSVEQKKESSIISVWRIWSDCVQSGSSLRECAASFSSSYILDLTCSDSVRLVNGTSLCSGRLEVKTRKWSSVCEADFDQQDAEVVCRELGCGAPSVLQGMLFGEVEAPVSTKEFQCGGNEYALLDCRSSGSDRNNCSSGKAVGLSCSEPVRLVGGLVRCTGSLEVKHQGDWRPVIVSGLITEVGAVACRELGCLSPVSVGWKKESSVRSVWMISSDCVQSGFTLRECAVSYSHSSILNLICSSPSVTQATGPRPFIIKAVVLLLTLLLVNVSLYFYYKASRGQQTDTQEDIELNHYHMGVPAVEEEQTEEEGAE